MPEDKDDWRWIDEHIERPTPEIATDAVLTSRGEGGASQDEEKQTQSEYVDRDEHEQEGSEQNQE